MPTIIVVAGDGTSREFDVSDGLSILQIARMEALELEGRCEGSLACGTCHVMIDPVSFGKLPAPSTDEQDMLDTVAGLTATSRLGCQVRVTDLLGGMIVTLLRP